MAYFVTIQQTNSLLKFGDENSYIALVISIFAIYGIFYTFVQFALNYTLQSGKDRYWGRSKIKTLLIDSVEYRLFNSKEFKILLIISALVPILRGTLHDNPYINQYYNIIISIFCISLGAIYVLYTLLFVRSLDIMMNFFEIQEGYDFYLEYDMKNGIKNYYKELFNYSYQDRSGTFWECFSTDLTKLNQNERSDMFIYVFYGVINSFEKKQYFEIEKITRNKNVSLRIIEEFNERIVDLERLFMSLWEYIEKNIELDFFRLLNLYKLQERVLFKQIYIANSGHNSEIEKNICNYKMYFKVPKIIYSKANSINDIDSINKFIRNREIDGKLLSQYFDDSKNIELDKYQKIIFDEYYDYMHELLDKCKEIQNKIKRNDLVRVFGVFYKDQDNLKISRKMQNVIYSYIEKLECSSSNKEFISLILESLDDIYTIIIILYFVLCTDSNSKWKKEIIFLKNIIYRNYYFEYILEEKNVDFICKALINKIEDKVNYSLVKWIIHNISNSLEEETIKKCIVEDNITYAQLIKLKFIFNINNNYYFDFQNIKLDNLLIYKTYDWRMGFLREMLLTPDLLKEEFFYMHQFNFFEYILQPSMPRELYEEYDFRMIYINPSIYISRTLFLKMINEKFLLKKGIFEFLILKINDEGYEYLLSNNRISKIFISKIKEIVDNGGISVESYLDNLVEKANECSCNDISDYKKKSILHKLNGLVY
jgi:hypothetical protein